jgi:hypothetical protein
MACASDSLHPIIKTPDPHPFDDTALTCYLWQRPHVGSLPSIAHRTQISGIAARDGTTIHKWSRMNDW